MKHPCRQVETWQYDYKLRRSEIFITRGVNQSEEKPGIRFGGIFAKSKNHDKTKSQYPSHLQNYKRMKRLFFIAVWLFVTLAGRGQQIVSDSAQSAFIPFFSFSYQFPGGDIARRYGQNATIGGGFHYKTNKNWLWTADLNFIFGNDIKNAESILKMVQTHDGYIIDGNGTYALYALYERGFSVNTKAGKIIPLFHANPNSGLMFSGGIGYLMHRLKIDNQHHTAPQISYDYAKGYDRLNGGVVFSEFIGYFFMGKTRVLNFYGGLELQQAFTKSRRDYVFDLMKKDTRSYTDLFFGIKIGWMVPVNRRMPDAYYYY